MRLAYEMWALKTGQAGWSSMVNQFWSIGHGKVWISGADRSAEFKPAQMPSCYGKLPSTQNMTQTDIADTCSPTDHEANDVIGVILLVCYVTKIENPI